MRKLLVVALLLSIGCPVVPQTTKNIAPSAMSLHQEMCRQLVMEYQTLSFEQSCMDLVPYHVVLHGVRYYVKFYTLTPSDSGYGTWEQAAKHWLESCRLHEISDDRPKEWHDAEMDYCHAHFKEGIFHGWYFVSPDEKEKYR